MEISHSIYLGGITRFACLKLTQRLYLFATAGTLWKVIELFMIGLILKGIAIALVNLDLEIAIPNRRLFDRFTTFSRQRSTGILVWIAFLISMVNTASGESPGVSLSGASWQSQPSREFGDG